jgi:predicted phosphodiesterase
MRIAILADIHGNVLALEAVLTDLQSRKVDKFANLGDCVRVRYGRVRLSSCS